MRDKSPKETTKEVAGAAFSAVIDVTCVVLAGVFAYKGFAALKRFIER